MLLRKGVVVVESVGKVDHFSELNNLDVPWKCFRWRYNAPWRQYTPDILWDDGDAVDACRRFNEPAQHQPD